MLAILSHGILRVRLADLMSDTFARCSCRVWL
jgi:hypothetical protein